jgi:Flp pilus assembly protein TadD
MGYDAFGLFRGWCIRASGCLEYSAQGVAQDAADANPLRCSHCRCLPQEHVPAKADGYNPNSAEHLAERRKYDVRLLPPEERATIFKARADAAFRERNYRNAYLEYTKAIEATPYNHVLLGNRCQTYLKVGKVEAALLDAERAVDLAPEWPKAHYRLGLCLQQKEQFNEAVSAFERACSLDEGNAECRKALDGARAKRLEWLDLQEQLAKARKRTTIRQASDQYEEAKFEAKRTAKGARAAHLLCEKELYAGCGNGRVATCAACCGHVACWFGAHIIARRVRGRPLAELSLFAVRAGVLGAQPRARSRRSPSLGASCSKTLNATTRPTWCRPQAWSTR